MATRECRQRRHHATRETDEGHMQQGQECRQGPLRGTRKERQADRGSRTRNTSGNMSCSRDKSAQGDSMPGPRSGHRAGPILRPFSGRKKGPKSVNRNSWGSHFWGLLFCVRKMDPKMRPLFEAAQGTRMGCEGTPGGATNDMEMQTPSACVLHPCCTNARHVEECSNLRCCNATVPLPSLSFLLAVGPWPHSSTTLSRNIIQSFGR